MQHGATSTPGERRRVRPLRGAAARPAMAKVGVVVKPPATLCPAHDLLSRMRGLPPGCCDHDRDLNGRIGGTSLPAMWPALVSIGTLLKGVGSSPVRASISRVCPAAAG